MVVGEEGSILTMNKRLKAGQFNALSRNTAYGHSRSIDTAASTIVIASLSAWP
jgi:hypothetical protein